MSSHDSELSKPLRQLSEGAARLYAAGRSALGILPSRARTQVLSAHEGNGSQTEVVAALWALKRRLRLNSAAYLRLTNGFRILMCLAFVNLAGSLPFALGNACAESDAVPIKLIFGDQNTPRDAGEVVISLTVYGYISGEDAFPAISADGTQVALLYGSHEIYDGWALDIVDVERRASIERFYLNWSREDFSPLREPEEIRTRMQAANTYLENGGFRSIEPLFDFYHSQTDGTRRHYFGREQSEPRQTELDAWRIVYWAREDRLEIFDQHLEFTAFTLSLPLHSYGIRAGYLCQTRPQPLMGWYDADADVLIVGLMWLTSHLACDRPPRWLVERLRPTS